jgi:RNA polymerase-binding transcription factor DksA
MTIDYEYFKKKLEAEKKVLEAELEKIGRRNPDRAGDWEAVPSTTDTSEPDENLVADQIEEYDDNVAIVNTLEPRYQELKDALVRLENGTYGICTVGGEEIDADRLEANPSASTCRLHMT